MKKIFFIVLLLVSMVSSAYAETVTAMSKWTYNGTNTTGGFELQKQVPGQTTWELVKNVADPKARSLTFTFTPVVGRTLFRHRAYSGDQVGEWSDLAAYEYMEGSSIPQTTVILQYTMKQ